MKDTTREQDSRFEMMKLFSNLSPELHLAIKSNLQRSIKQLLNDFYDGDSDKIWKEQMEVFTLAIMEQYNLNKKRDRIDAGRFLLACYWPIFKDLVQITDEATQLLIDMTKGGEVKDAFEAMTLQMKEAEKARKKCGMDEDEDEDDDEECICDDCKNKSCRKGFCECEKEEPETDEKTKEALAWFFGVVKKSFEGKDEED